MTDATTRFPDEDGRAQASGLIAAPGTADSTPPSWRGDAPASRADIDIGEIEAEAASRAYWEATADEYQAQHGGFLAGSSVSGHAPSDPGAGFVWGPEGLSEHEAQMLGPINELAGRAILEVGAGAGQCSRWLTAQGVRAVALDAAIAQLRHAIGPVPAVAGSGIALPFRDDVFDAAFSSYGAVQFVANLDVLLAEVARVLRPGARWVFSVTHPIRWAFPDEPGPQGLSVTGSYFDRTPYVERATTGGPVVYAEFHRTLGDYVDALGRAGFGVDRVVEPEWPQWNENTWGGWSPLRGMHLPGTLIIGSRAGRGQP